MQSAEPAAAYEPASHGVQAGAPAREKVLAGQGAHERAPVEAANVPAAQYGHTVVEVAEDAVPGAHCAHEAAVLTPVVAAPVVPAPQGEQAVAPASEKKPALHATHAAPEGGANVPAGQAAAHAEAPEYEKAPAGVHGAHDPTAPGTADAVPARQGVEVVDVAPVAAAKEPAGAE